MRHINQTRTKSELRRYRRVHSIKQCYERYQVVMTDKDYCDIVWAIQNMQKYKPDCADIKVKFIQKEIKNRSLFSVFVFGQWLLLIYDKQTHSICTFLPGKLITSDGDLVGNLDDRLKPKKEKNAK